MASRVIGRLLVIRETHVFEYDKTKNGACNDFANT